MASNNPFLDLRVKAGDVQRSVNWYQAQIRSLRNIKPSVNRLLAADTQHLTTNYLPGRLYLFQYDAKHKDTLPYWDALPLVFPFRKVQGGFYGINLHYLPYGLRFTLMSNLLSMTAESEDRRMKLSWQFLTASSKFRGVDACVKHYLHDHVQSRFLNIPPDQWLAASMLPIEQFQNSSKEAVFRASRKSI
jgi:hypothetical protein